MSEEIPTKPILSDSEGSQAPKKPPERVITVSKKLVYTGIILVIIIMGFTVIMAKLINENSQCIINPFVYGAEKIESSRGEPDPFCSCTINDGTFCACTMINGGAFWFDDKEVYLENPFFNPELRS